MILSSDLNRTILSLAPAHIVRDIAPDTFAGIVNAPGIVWSGASDCTIYGDAIVNYAARAWHNACHISAMADFTLQGEARACELQIVQLFSAMPRAPKLWADILRAEVTGQARYFARYGVFPLDQFAFVLSHLERD